MNFQESTFPWSDTYYPIKGALGNLYVGKLVGLFDATGLKYCSSLDYVFSRI